MGEGSSSYTLTQRLQVELESAVGSLYEAFDSATNKERSLLLKLHRDEHEEYVVRGLRRLSAGFYVLDSSRPWLCYWILHSLALLGRPIAGDLYDRTVDFLQHCQDPNGGYGGGPGQMPHLATTYAATCALVTLGGERALSSINRKKTLQFLLRMKDPCGGFRVHDDGEMDMRGSFTALAVAHLLDIVVPELMEKVGEHVGGCQTYEGGIGGEPGSEAHGGYTFCGLAALALINQLHVLDLPSLVNWVAFRQGKVEGGFQGRTNKLVDGCYSFWQGGCFQLLQQQVPHLVLQQKTSAGTLHTSQGEIQARNVGPLISKSPEHYGSTESDIEARTLKAEGESPGSVLSEVQGQRPKSGTDCSSCGEDSMLSKEETHDETYQETCEAPLARINSMQEIQRATATEVQARKEFHSPTREFLAKEWNIDEDEDEFWDLESKPHHNAAEKLFPMSDAQIRRVPSHDKHVELVELADDSQVAQMEVSGSSCNSTKSTVALGILDDTLDGPIFNSQALQAYILLCCQDLDGGLRDKPGKPCDYYHTCYCLSGLAAAQYSTAHRTGAPPPPSGVVGPYSNLVEATHSICNVRLDRYYEAQSYFKRTKL